MIADKITLDNMLLTHGEQKEILKNTITTTTTAVQDVLQGYTPLDEDELFDYEEEFLVFRVDLNTHSSRYGYETKQVVVQFKENGSIGIEVTEDKINVARQSGRGAYEVISSRDIKCALETKIHDRNVMGGPILTKTQMLIPRLYTINKEPTTVFTAKDGRNRVIQEGQVYLVNKDFTLELDEELTEVYNHGKVITPEVEAAPREESRPMSTSDVLASEAFRAIRSALAHRE